MGDIAFGPKKKKGQRQSYRQLLLSYTEVTKDLLPI